MEQLKETKRAERELALLKYKYDQLNSQNNKRMYPLLSLANYTNSLYTVAETLIQTNTMKTKLENLCKELYQQNAKYVEENKTIVKEQDEKRLQLSEQFKNSINDVEVRMKKMGDERLETIKENEAYV